MAWVPGAQGQSEAPAATSQNQPPEGSVGGMGDINLYPKRIVLQDRQRIATLGLYNRAPAEGNYEIKLSDKMMMPDGKLVAVEDIEDEAYRARLKSAIDLLRWSPRKIALPPSEAQTVRIMARIPPELPPGEYRTHLSVTQVPAIAPGGFSIEAASGKARANSIGVTIVPRFGISIPVIVRVGETTLQTELRNIAVTPLGGGHNAISLVIARSGSRSAFGDLKVTLAGSNKPIGVLKGIGVYPEIDQRSVTIPLDPEVPPSTYARGKKLTVTYIDDDYRPGQVLASQDITVP
ncbi:MAG: hypothetical protein KDE32_15070 [Novosphingobium sp.]|nr:hypothetical protein [Novosphingobium sp.]